MPDKSIMSKRPSIQQGEQLVDHARAEGATL
jgi:hypothetical protein